MELVKSDLSIATLLDLMEGQTPEAIHLNHMVIGDELPDLPVVLSLEQLPSFTAQFGGFVEVEFYMDFKQRNVIRLVIRQSAMTFSELDMNGDVLPNLTIDCQVLSTVERARLNHLSRRYIKDGKMLDRSRGQALLTQYVEKAMFCTKKYGGMTNA